MNQALLCSLTDLSPVPNGNHGVSLDHLRFCPIISSAQVTVVARVPGIARTRWRSFVSPDTTVLWQILPVSLQISIFRDIPQSYLFGNL